MKTHAPTETRYHIHRLQMVGIVALLELAWVGLFLSIPRVTSYSSDALTIHYGRLLVADTLTVPIIAAMASFGVILAVGILTGRRVQWTLLVTTPLLLIGWSLFVIRNNDEAGSPVAFLIVGILILSLFHRMCTTRHYSKLWDIGTMLILVVGIILSFLPSALTDLSMGVEQHMETISLDSETYHLAQVKMYDWGSYRKTQQLILFRCENRYGQCYVVHKHHLTDIEPSFVGVTTEKETFVITYGEGDIYNFSITSYIYDPNEQ